MPPRHGQSQFISPVSSLNAPSDEASSSVSERAEEDAGSVGNGALGGEGASGNDSDGLCCCCEEAFWRVRLTVSRVGREVSSVGESGIGTE